MDSAPGNYDPERVKADPQSSGPERERAELRPSTIPALERRGQAYTAPPTFDEPDKPKPAPSRLMPVVAAVMVAVAAGVSSWEYFHNTTVVPDRNAAQVTLSGADQDQATTSRVVAEIKAGGNEPEIADLTAQEKAELLDGERQFYAIPLSSLELNAANGATHDGGGERIQISTHGLPHGEYTLGGQPVTLDLPLKIGDQFNVTCVSLAEGESTVVVKLATALNPVETVPLAAGQSETFTVQAGAGGQNYAWFLQEAQAGNAVAQYGLGHMYQYGIGVPRDLAQAAYWYRQAAAQNYQDAQAQLNRLGGS